MSAAPVYRPSQWSSCAGKPVISIGFSGVSAAKLQPLPGKLAQQPATPLETKQVQASLRSLFATGLYDNIEVECSTAVGQNGQTGVSLQFRGVARTFVGAVNVDGAKGPQINAQLALATRLSPGTRYKEGALVQAEGQMRRLLADNGFHQPTITHRLTFHPEDQLVDIFFTVVSGEQARVGSVTVQGQPGMSVGAFRGYARLRSGSRVDRDTTSRALAGILKHYRREDRLEAEIRLEAGDYLPATRTEDYRFLSNRGPVVRVTVDGAKMSDGRVKRLVPVYQEGSVDEDLLNEGNRRLRDYYQQQGYFDVRVQHAQKTQLLPPIPGAKANPGTNSGAANADLGKTASPSPTDPSSTDPSSTDQAATDTAAEATATPSKIPPPSGIPSDTHPDRPGTGLPATGLSEPGLSDRAVVEIVYTVALGSRHRVVEVTVTGNRYFDKATLEEHLSVKAADPFDRHGIFSQSLVTADVGALQAVYENNGFAHVKITPEVSDPDAAVAAGTVLPGKAGKQQIPVRVTYRIEEGEQTRVASVALDGVSQVPEEPLKAMLNTAPGQPLSPANVAGDRDTLLAYYLSRGFEHARVDVSEQTERDDAGRYNVIFHITEGEQVFVGKVLVTGLAHTRPDTIAPLITLRAGDPLNETALLEMQRSLYNLALFSEVNTAVENPEGSAMRKTVLVQTTEARRWDISYGGGFEAQTGTPQNNCSSASVSSCSPNGSTGVSPKLIFDVTRINLFSKEESASLLSTYGLLEQRISLVFQNPRFFGNRDLAFSVSAGYSNSQDVTTYTASRLSAGVRLTERFLTENSLLSKANTLIYEYNFRRVQVNKDSIQVAPDEIPLLSEPVRVGGPGFTWIRDTRDVPLDAHRGTYLSFQEFLASSKFGSEADFNRVDLSHSSYYPLDKGKLILARNTRFGYERAFGDPAYELIPLPERLYAGGANSHRGFGINAAGPRDPTTGYPIGGAGALINSTELRLPPPTLPFFGTALSFVAFHDMGNVFTNSSDMWAGALRVRQPHHGTCEDLSLSVTAGESSSTGQQGPCSFNYFSHAVGLGLRYHTPVGPIRLDFSDNLNPPIYPVHYDYSDPTRPPYLGQGPHFNFFFSLGQTF